MTEQERVGLLLEEIYSRYHRPEYIDPDPILYPRRYENLQDREIAALIASSLALGRVDQIMKAAGTVLAGFEKPFDDIRRLEYRDFEKIFEGFTYRFFKTSHIAGFLSGIRGITERFGSLGECFREKYREQASLVEAVHEFSRELIGSCHECPGILVTESWKGSAFKRFNLFLRWMVRKDCIDPGGWDFIGTDELIVPLDTHMMRIGRYLGFTERSLPSIKTAVEISENLKKYDKMDPVRFDFSLTRLGIHPDLTIDKIRTFGGEKK